MAPRTPTSTADSARAADPARAAALEVLEAVRTRDAYANLLLPRVLRDRGLSGRDAAFTTELCYGTLRGLGTYDAIIAACVDRELDAVDPVVLDALRIGAHQLLAMDVPPHAAVSTSVDLVRSVSNEGASRFANAILRRVGQGDLQAWIKRIAPDPQDDPEGFLTVSRSHPRWIVSALWDSLQAHRGAERAHKDIGDLLDADNARPGVTLVTRPGLAQVGDLTELGALAGRYSPYAAYLAGGDPGALAPVREGRAGVQDEGSQLVANALAMAPLEGRDEWWLDMCAGPGGKAALLAGLALERGASLLANEIAPHRAELVRRALRGYGDRLVGAEAVAGTRVEAATSAGIEAEPDAELEAEFVDSEGDGGEGGAEVTLPGTGTLQVIAADGIRAPWQPGSFDRVMLDAPCTGLGALRRRPESRWRRGPEDLERLTRVQRRLLSSALDSVRPGGLVAYVTCSPHLEETRDVVRQVVKARRDVERVDARPLLPGVPDLGGGPDVQLWPHLHGTDAMYLTLLRRS
ncbi:rRNA cytosine-C5-methyltransferase [Catenulispora sp. NF23]|uniref:rRNA cytosine-C5-methyltransferase n=1 Tax=Catenulispora pinistramenti TaxID=2705254 RepID=A0ABS5L3C9_9ACTN|nr:transcription antitermination factor NusB [Catenulispora pinistramenti]MBS2536692.1 rRNA cytosine-C5-methyltransferase [Catenulispora pinistramenti]MBS2552845.1 rRNA cytosine-C5-methyltransferase [Catenulispora pinistramenti]